MRGITCAQAERLRDMEDAARERREEAEDARREERRLDRLAAEMVDISADEIVRDALAWIGRSAFVAAIGQGQPFEGACYFAAATADRAELDEALDAYAFLEE